MRALMLLPILFLAGCGLFEKQIDVHSVATEVTVLQPADPHPIELQGVHFFVVNKNNLQTFLNEIKKEQNTEEFVFIAVSTKGFENLSLDFQELKRYIDQQGEIIIYYKKVTADKSE